MIFQEDPSLSNNCPTKTSNSRFQVWPDCKHPERVPNPCKLSVTLAGSPLIRTIEKLDAL